MTLDLKNVAEDRYSHVTVEVIQLIQRAKEFATTLDSFPADTLWRAARRTFPRSVVSTMRRQEKKWAVRSHKPSWYVLELILHLEREVEFLSAQSLGDDREFYLARGLLARYASITRQSLDRVIRDWSNASWALRELALDMKVPLTRRRSESAQAAIADCERCWRTGHRTYKGGHLCGLHSSGSDAYFESLRLDIWRAPDQKWPNESFEMAVIRRLARTVKSGLNPKEAMNGPFLKNRLRNGDSRALSGFREYRVDLGEWWSKFPYAKHHLSPDLSAAGLPMTDAGAVLRALDPIQGSHQTEQALVHQALLQDQRHLLELLRTAEAWLETRAMMLERWGGYRRKGDTIEDLPRYAILSVRPARRFKKKSPAVRP